MPYVIGGYRVAFTQLFEFLMSVIPGHRSNHHVQTLLDFEKPGYCVVTFPQWLHQLPKEERDIKFSCKCSIRVPVHGWA